MSREAVLLATALVAGCASNKPNDSTAPTERSATTRCWVGQLTQIDESGYRVASVPMLLRIKRNPDTHRMTRELALGNPAALQHDVFFIDDAGKVSFVETDLRAKGYEASGEIAGNPWASDEMSLELSLPHTSVRVREWADDGILYGHYRYRDETGEYGDERFHALSPLDSGACSSRVDRAREGTLRPDPSRAAWAESAAPQPPQVTLNFDWPANLDATIRARVLRTGTPTSAPNAVDATYQLRTWPNNDGTKIEVRSRELLAVPQHTLEDKERWERAKVLVSLFPAVRVDFEGQVAALAEPDDYLDTVRAAFLERFAGGRESKDEEANTYLDANLSPDLAVLSAQRYWNPLVAFWAGATMEIGKTEKVRLVRALWFPGAIKPVEVQIPVEYGIEGWVKCQPDAAEAACVKLVSNYSINEHDVRMPLANAGPDGRPIRVMKHLDETHSVLVADPTTLIPYHYYEERVLESLSGGADDGSQVRRTETMDLTFIY